MTGVLSLAIISLLHPSLFLTSVLSPFLPNHHHPTSLQCKFCQNKFEWQGPGDPPDGWGDGALDSGCTSVFYTDSLKFWQNTGPRGFQGLTASVRLGLLPVWRKGREKGNNRSWEDSGIEEDGDQEMSSPLLRLRSLWRTFLLLLHFSFASFEQGGATYVGDPNTIVPSAHSPNSPFFPFCAPSSIVSFSVVSLSLSLSLIVS